MDYRCNNSLHVASLEDNNKPRKKDGVLMKDSSNNDREYGRVLVTLWR
jgi:hypothetical protein